MIGCVSQVLQSNSPSGTVANRGLRLPRLSTQNSVCTHSGKAVDFSCRFAHRISTVDYGTGTNLSYVLENVSARKLICGSELLILLQINFCCRFFTAEIISLVVADCIVTRVDLQWIFRRM